MTAEPPAKFSLKNQKNEYFKNLQSLVFSICKFIQKGESLKLVSLLLFEMEFLNFWNV
jgi:hypothetical protein